MGISRILRGIRSSRPGWPPADRVVDRKPVLDGPPLSVIVICREMRHQIANTIYSLLPPYQQNINANQYQVRVIDNGSIEPLPHSLWQLGPNVTYQHVPREIAPVNPGVAINRAVAETNSPMLCIMIDGARMVTPGTLRWGIDLAMLSMETIVEVRGWHLGPKLQMLSVLEGYDSSMEQRLLEAINWPDDGYKLFDISVPVATAPGGFLGPAAECTCIFLSRTLFDELGGFDERYSYPGGGLCNADFFARAVIHAHRVFTVLGEGTFHQLHGGAATGQPAPELRNTFRKWKAEYQKLSRPWKKEPSKYKPILCGHLPGPARRWLMDTPSTRLDEELRMATQ